MLFLISGFAGNSSASRGADAAAMYLSAYPENCLAELLHPGKAFHIVAKYYAIMFFARHFSRKLQIIFP
jgi:hypothetical protein